MGRPIALVALFVASACTANQPSTPLPPSLTLSPEPEGCEYHGRILADEVDPATLSSTTLPRWLPPGMALVVSFGNARAGEPLGDGILEGVQYVDDRCRRVEVYLLDEQERVHGERVGPWAIVSDFHGCVLDGGGRARCITYWTNVHQGLLMVRTKGMNREHADRVVLSLQAE